MARVWLEATELKNYTIIDDKVWYICGNNNSMFIYDPNANTTTLVEEFEEEHDWRRIGFFSRKKSMCAKVVVVQRRKNLYG